MLNLSDKEIDQLSRDAADSYEPDHSSLSWSRLEQKLTEQMPERPPDGFRFGRINPYIWGPAVVLIAGISFYLIKKNNYSQLSTPAARSVVQSVSPSAADKNKTEGNTIQTDPASARSSSASSVDGKETDTKKDLNLTDVPGGGASRSSGQSDDADANSQKNDVYRQNSDVYSQKSIRNSGKNNSHRHPLVPAVAALTGNNLAANSMDASGSLDQGGFSSSVNKGTNKQSDVNIPSNATARIPASLPPLATSDAVLGSVHGNDALLNRAKPAHTVVSHKTLHVDRSLNFGFVFGPDYTDAGGISNNQFGNNIGLSVGYYLNNKFSLNTGIIYSNKFFWTPGHSAGGPLPSNTGGVSTFAAGPTIEYVNGQANLYEVPLTLRYDFMQSGKSKFFANAGLSSYFIVNQSYIYFFHRGYRASASKVTDNSQENYWFGVADLSFGMETEIGKGFSFQVEPFFKIPIKQMGLQNVKLNSYGVLLSFRYTPVLSRSKK